MMSPSFISCPLSLAARTYHDQPALVTPTGTLSFLDYDHQVSAVADNLKNMNLKTGERIAVVAPKQPELPAIILGCIRAGMVVCLLSPRLPDQTLENNFRQLNSRVLITPSDDYRLQHLKPLKTGELVKPVMALSDVIHRGDLNQDATVMWTSGSATEPKAVLHTFGNHYYNALGANKNIPFEPGDRWLLSLPLYHVGGLSLLFRAVLGGGAVVLPEPGYKLAEEIIKHRITHLSLVSTQLYRLIETPEELPSLKKTLKVVLLGGGPFPHSLIDKALGFQLPLYKSYGLTETASQVTTTSRTDYPDRLFTSGRALDYRQVKISDNNEILVKGAILFKGYLEPQGLKVLIDEDGWFHTGDCGHTDADGFLTVTGRKDNMFISGGENIQPEEIENCLLMMEDILDAVVVPIADREFGFRPAAFIRMAGNRERDENRICRHLERYLPLFKIPRYFFDWPKNSVSESLKPERRNFQKMARERLI